MFKSHDPSSEMIDKKICLSVSFYSLRVMGQMDKIQPMRSTALSKTFSLVILLLVAACDSDDGPGDIQLTSGNIETIAGMGPTKFGFEGDNGPAISAKIGWVTGVAVDNSGNVYLTDGAANVVRKVSGGNITTIAGTFIGFNQINNTPYAGDGGSAIFAHLNVPHAASVDDDGNVIVADAANNAVRQILAASGNITTVAGKGPGLSGYTGDGGLSAQSQMWNPHGVTFDASGNIYISDTQNNAVRMISKSTGKITTVAGLGPNNPGYSGDNGPSSTAALNSPEGLAIDSDGSIYISDSGNNVIRRISNGIITTIAGTGAQGYSGDEGPALEATFLTLRGLAVDSEDNLYVADAANNVIRMIHAATGKIYTVAGNGTAGFEGDGGLAIDAKLSNPLGVALDNLDNLYIADTNNSAIRKVTR